MLRLTCHDLARILVIRRHSPQHDLIWLQLGHTLLEVLEICSYHDLFVAIEISSKPPDDVETAQRTALFECPSLASTLTCFLTNPVLDTCSMLPDT